MTLWLMQWSFTPWTHTLRFPTFFKLNFRLPTLCRQKSDDSFSQDSSESVTNQLQTSERWFVWGDAHIRRTH